MIKKLLMGCALLLPVAATQAQADGRDEMLLGISRCSAIADNRTFLECAYGAAQPLRAELGLPPAPASQTALVPSKNNGGSAGGPARPSAPPPTAEASSSGGFFSGLLGPADVKTPPTPMASYSFDHDGAFTVTLKNGQVWRQVADGSQMARWKKPAATYIATVTAGALGSFNMQIQGEDVSYKVKRLR